MVEASGNLGRLDVVVEALGFLDVVVEAFGRWDVEVKAVAGVGIWDGVLEG